ncbi:MULTISPECIES: AraC family transcriptional regulator [Glycomyces]|uniref:HTH-type transcriptional regulator RipA n=2 Tax=Glycomyces TaxID=58113 RepID=A0A9X3PHW3_9ACTN|nr:helix-turn-helix transcriptional regulator [Glycomyces lechevalierae]MDA1385167.1 helix-turn-helix transcriptional regulator [Glycomyces lechevalierae]MDR7337217.1 AraC-like DNA-binding protein [Glycomyces lechevalierae]
MSIDGQIDGRSIPSSPIRTLTHMERIDWHRHDGHQLIYPRRGVLRVFTATGVWVVPPSQGVWIPAGHDHAHRACGTTEMRAILFATESPGPFIAHPTVLAFTPLLREAVTCLTDDAGLEAATRGHLERVVLDLLRGVEAPQRFLPALPDPRLREVVALLEDDPSDRRTLAQLGTAIGASERTLSRLFREQAGMTFAQWRGQFRLHHALVLLAEGHQVTRIAGACGYASPSAFIGAFREAFGLTPGEYLRREPDLRL